MLKVEWLDGHREPQCPPDPQFPDGIDMDLSDGAERTCSTPVPYPSPRCGLLFIECSICGIRVGVTTAGRPDDARSVKIPCKIRSAAQ